MTLPPHPRPPALDLAGVPDDAVVVAYEVRLGVDRRHDEQDVRLGERGTQLLLLAAQQLGQIRVAAGGLVIGDRVPVELSEAPERRFVG